MGPRQNGRHCADDIFLNENIWIPIKISLKFIPKGAINNIPALVQMMASCRPGDKPLSEPMLVSLPMHICIIRLNELSVSYSLHCAIIYRCTMHWFVQSLYNILHQSNTCVIA